MTVEQFMELLIKELEENEELRNYYRLIDSKKYFLFRKAYLEQRLAYVNRNVPNENQKIWDVGCGYASTGILLALSGHKVVGSTLEYYYDKIQKRLDYWSRYGDVSSLDIKYENIFEIEHSPAEFDIIIAQDTLHHLEPINDAMRIFHHMLKDDGKLIISEENGRNIFCAAKHFRERGFNRITKIYDEKLKKQILFGNENTRSFSKWNKIFSDSRFSVDESAVEYIRFFPPARFNLHNYTDVIKKEQTLWRKSGLLREFFFFGFNFTAKKQAL